MTDRFGPTVGSKLIKPSGIKKTSWGDTVRSNTLNLQPPLRRAELPGALAPPLPRAEPATRCAEPARFVGVATHDWLQPPVHSGGPSSLISRSNCALKAEMDSSSYGAHACMLGARFGVRAAEVRHLAVLECAWVHGMSSVLAANPPNERIRHR